ncbi:SAM-dependent methyltransferase [Haloferax sp. Atlit-6N]|uniref:class I SAM-dependent methyltransferase n=1 Tax=Haloferax sp. Atlit-6N TaxID=2077205 RepID=UPI000E242989|nr:class I SAM-dependent methyltransferase [Haloferax sp. Atlit-6N]REA05077.1 SAM-dependent methyltransferase [Haloferax sp. Atlit-6N]
MPDDALGLAMLDRVRGCLRAPCVYRAGDDARGTAGDAHIYENYLVPSERWPAAKREFVDSLRTPVLDVGCGAGQHALAVQGRGDVVAFDVSPNAVRAARERGVEAAVVGDMFDPPVEASRAGLPAGGFETVLANGTQVGLAGSLDRLADLLASFADLVSSAGEVVVDSYDPTRIDPERFFGYRSDPREGVARRSFRVEYGDLRGPMLDFVLVSPARLRAVAAEAGLDVREVTVPNTESSYYRARLA